MGSLKQTFEQLAEQWKKLPATARFALAAVASVGAMVAVALALFGGEDKRVLFSGLDPRDAAGITRALDSAKIDYELGAGGSVIRVTDSQIDRARLLLAEQDLPKTGNVGFEMFEEQHFGLTDFAQQINYRRALQGELERTIMEIDAVGTARIHITQPRQAVFEDEKIAPTASVTLNLVAGRELTERNVGAIRHLVASAVEGLEAGDVTVVDTRGNLLSRGDLGDGATTAALDYKTDMERDLERKLVRMLERTVGVGGAEVRVSAEVDFSRTDTTEEVYDPEQVAVRNESMQEIFEGDGATRTRGVAGAQANTPDATPAQGAGGGGESSRVTRSKNYEINRTVVRTVGPTATLKRVTVAVLVDGTYTLPEDGGAPVFNPRSEDELRELQAVIESAMGFNTARGDRIKIASVPFRDRVGQAELVAPPSAGMPTWMPYALGGGGLLVVVTAWLVLARRRRKTVLEPEVLHLPGATVKQAQAALAAAENKGDPVAAMAALAPAPAISPSREDILALAAADPERTADIIRAWLTSDHAA